MNGLLILETQDAEDAKLHGYNKYREEKNCQGLLNTKASSLALGIHQAGNHSKLGKYFWGNFSSVCSVLLCICCWPQLDKDTGPIHNGCS